MRRALRVMSLLQARKRYYTEWIRLLWIALFGLAGGISGLVLTLDSFVRAVLLIFAVLLVVHHVDFEG